MVTLEKKRGTGDGGQTVIVIDPATGLPVPGATNPILPRSTARAARRAWPGRYKRSGQPWGEHYDRNDQWQ